MDPQVASVEAADEREWELTDEDLDRTEERVSYTSGVSCCG